MKKSKGVIKISIVFPVLSVLSFYTCLIPYADGTGTEIRPCPPCNNIEELEKAVHEMEMDKDNVDGNKYAKLLQELAECYISIGKHEKAIDIYEKRLDLEWWDPAALRLVGCYRETRQYQKAINTLKKAIEMDESLDILYSHYIGSLQYESGDLNESVKVLHSVLRGYYADEAWIYELNVKIDYLKSLIYSRKQGYTFTDVEYEFQQNKVKTIFYDAVNQLNFFELYFLYPISYSKTDMVPFSQEGQNEKLSIDHIAWEEIKLACIYLHKKDSFTFWLWIKLNALIYVATIAGFLIVTGLLVFTIRKYLRAKR